MNNSVTTTKVHYTNTEEYNKANTKWTALDLKSRIENVLSSLISQIIVFVVVALFSLVIKFKPFKCLSGFCYDNNSKA